MAGNRSGIGNNDGIDHRHSLDETNHCFRKGVDLIKPSLASCKFVNSCTWGYMEEAWPKKKRGRPRTEMLSRNIEISSFRMSVRLHATHRRGEEPYIESGPWLELIGKADELINGVTDIRISMYPKDELEVGTARPAAIGAIIQVKPEIAMVLTWTHTEFDRVWAMALGGQLKYAHVYCTQPERKTALVTRVSFSNER
jgi:hypothetical protein